MPSTQTQGLRPIQQPGSYWNISLVLLLLLLLLRESNTHTEVIACDDKNALIRVLDFDNLVLIQCNIK